MSFKTREDAERACRKGQATLKDGGKDWLPEVYHGSMGWTYRLTRGIAVVFESDVSGFWCMLADHPGRVGTGSGRWHGPSGTHSTAQDAFEAELRKVRAYIQEERATLGEIERYLDAL